jgi:hypothetical protein
MKLKVCQEDEASISSLSARIKKNKSCKLMQPPGMYISKFLVTCNKVYITPVIHKVYSRAKDEFVGL